jgi:hypothetical protein
MVAKIQILRSVTPGNRPAGKQYGEPYVNMGDNQFGVFDGSNVARDLIGVPMFSSSLSYIKGAPVNYQGILYVANQAVSAGAWNAAQWTQGGGAGATVADTPPTSPINGQLWWESDTGTLWMYYTDPNTSQWVAISGAAPSGAGVIQHVYAEGNTYQGISTAMAGVVDSIPQQTDGTQIFGLSIAITPKNASNKLRIRVVLPFVFIYSTAASVWMSVFQDSIAAALATSFINMQASIASNMILEFEMTAGTTASTTFKVRLGNVAGASTSIFIHGTGSGRWFGGSVKSVITVTELAT